MIKTIGRVISHFLWGMLSLCITLVIILGAAYAYMELQLPDVEVLKDVHMQVPLKVYTKDGVLIASYGAKRRIPVALDQVPKNLVNAVLAVEDARYYSHPGVDFISLLRAAHAVVSSGRKVQGASTITMQVARNFFLTRKKTYSRKIKEVLLALKIDKELSKDKVLELYLNKVYFGNRAYGVAAAAQVYYGKKLNRLTLPEMAMIAGLPQAPSRNNPLRNPRGALERRNHVLQRMYEVGYINKTTYLKAIKAPLTASYHGPRVQLYAPYIAEMVRRVLVAEYGDRAYESGVKVYTTIDSKLQQDARTALQSGLLAYARRHGFHASSKNFGWPTKDKLNTWLRQLRRYSGMDRLKPAIVLDTVSDQADALLANGEVITIPWSGMSWARPALRNGYVGSAPSRVGQVVKPGDLIWVTHSEEEGWKLSQVPQVQGALISLDPEDGSILAISGGFDYNLSNFNRAIQAERQPGSNFKPFIYSAALSKGFTLASIVNDAPIVIKDYGENRYWRPQNSDNEFYGPIRLRVGLMKSRNLVSVRLLQAVGIPFTMKYITHFGFDSNKLPHSLSLALGSGVVTPLQIAVGYAVFANGGYRVTPHFIDKITSTDDQVLFQSNPPKACTKCIVNPNLKPSEMPQPVAPRVITAQNAYLMTSALQSVIREGTGRKALSLGRGDLAGKTGTTNDKVDAWFSGFNSKLVTTVWVGFDNLRSLHEYGAQAALPIWIDFMKEALKDVPNSTMPQPPGIVTVRIDPGSGRLASSRSRHAVFEVFRKNLQPGKQQSRYAKTSGTGSGVGYSFHGEAGVGEQVGDSVDSEELF